MTYFNIQRGAGGSTEIVTDVTQANLRTTANQGIGDAPDTPGLVSAANGLPHVNILVGPGAGSVWVAGYRILFDIVNPNTGASVTADYTTVAGSLSPANVRDGIFAALGGTAGSSLSLGNGVVVTDDGARDLNFSVSYPTDSFYVSYAAPFIRNSSGISLTGSGEILDRNNDSTLAVNYRNGTTAVSGHNAVRTIGSGAVVSTLSGNLLAGQSTVPYDTLKHVLKERADAATDYVVETADELTVRYS